MDKIDHQPIERDALGTPTGAKAREPNREPNKVILDIVTSAEYPEQAGWKSWDKSWNKIGFD